MKREILADRVDEVFDLGVPLVRYHRILMPGAKGWGPAQWCAGRPLAVSAVSGFVPRLAPNSADVAHASPCPRVNHDLLEATKE